MTVLAPTTGGGSAGQTQTPPTTHPRPGSTISPALDDCGTRQSNGCRHAIDRRGSLLQIGHDWATGATEPVFTCWLHGCGTRHTRPTSLAHLGHGEQPPQPPQPPLEVGYRCSARPIGRPRCCDERGRGVYLGRCLGRGYRMQVLVHVRRRRHRSCFCRLVVAPDQTPSVVQYDTQYNIFCIGGQEDRRTA